MLSYQKIFRQAWAATKTYRFLYVYGLILFLSLALIFFLTNGDENSLANQGGSWPETLLLLGMLFVGFRAKAGLIVASREILLKRQTGFVSSLRSGRKFAVRIAGVLVLLAAVLVVIGIILSQPELTETTQLFLSLIYAAIGLNLFAATELACLFAVFYDLKLKDSLTSALNLIAKYWATLMILSLVLFVIQAVLPVLAAVVFIQIYGNIIMAAVAVFFLLSAPVALVFTQVCWALAFQELVRGIKLEEDKPIETILPEIAS
ncbi:MAG: hypothetical protein A3H72_00265 [Candidatus Doudnabacteria bacterium RIFCSPLOWO2_02_FULL_48_8]|uniref:Uncharacterized protein n=1 Tax=Candidatus Doudnabacteria bacterium RIFCSPHIGHO2_01_FULL_46_24 TaxID=1817825 RepID=A0A1F5NVU0_9BACT|nr:MAG: hypothetical protein A2720_00045 [Candidatus Doudnabacteria bacterium RIFCSPHIGHO2_01_FULL_46_24]OGE95301.1 MAG: hypothetical protein A3H72_00265 [Candidatus Doudnabacteria bacterium RIFCSPLOWO2_02_FULL_48_8]OGE95605.1 MAG: hypothetical protein A3E98_01235 [Candidatus Doudnabacteria bacterium RIFCSPHIGHO2_12_FULL_48_11]